jgi:hypothetical protein
MAGAGYKLFNTGDVLTAAQVNTYLQEQVVMVFANATARTAALSGVLAEGMVSYLQDTNAVEVYDGSAWVGIASGDITAVTAGTGISGGGTSGAVTITNSMATEITAAGDIIVGTGSGTFDNLPIGTTGQVLTADTTVSPYKVKWATAGGGGGTPTTAAATVAAGQTTTSTSYTDLSTSGPAATLTTGTKALVFITTNIDNQSNNGQGHVGFAVSGASTVSATDDQALHYYSSGTIALQYGAAYYVSGLTAGSNTFTLKYKSGNGSTQYFAKRQITVMDLGS